MDTTLPQIIQVLPVFTAVTSVVAITTAGVAWSSAKRAQRNNLDSAVAGINTAFYSSKVRGPIVCELFSERTPEEQLEVQGRIILLLHQVNYFRGYWSARRHRVFFVLPLPMVSRKDWRQNQHWFAETVWPWIRADKDLLKTIKHLLKKKDFQEDGFAKFFRKFVHKKAGDDFVNSNET
jgi:hypothetical protein